MIRLALRALLSEAFLVDRPLIDEQDATLLEEAIADEQGFVSLVSALAYMADAHNVMAVLDAELDEQARALDRARDTIPAPEAAA